MITLADVPEVPPAKVVEAWDEVAPAVLELVRHAGDSARMVKGCDWSINQLVAHLVSGLECYRDILRGKDSPFASVRAAHVAVLNQAFLDHILRRDEGLPDQLEHAQKVWRELITSETLPSTVRYHLGQPVAPMRVAAALLYEPIIHGHDLAMTLGRPWPITPGHVALIMWGLAPVLHGGVVMENARGFTATYQVRLRGQGTYTFRFEDGALTVGGPHEGRIDCRISADPATYLLVASGRLGRISPALRGQMIVYGRRPWLAARFVRLLEAP